MSQVSSSDIIACPICGNRYLVSRYASINFSNWREWSDGKAMGELYRPQAAATKCDGCKKPFLVKDAEVVGRVDWNDVIRRKQPNFLNRVWLRLTGKHVLDSEHIPEHVALLNLAELEELTLRFPLDISVELQIALRRQLWWASNDPFREASELIPLAQTMTSDANLKARNIEKLIGLLKVVSNPCWIEIGELFRETGRFSEARACFEKVSDDQAAIARFLSGLAKQGSPNVVRVDQLRTKKTMAVNQIRNELISTNERLVGEWIEARGGH